SCCDCAQFVEAGTAPIAAPPPMAGTEEPDEEQPAPSSPAFAVQSALQEAEWVIFAMLDAGEANPSSLALKQLLAQRQDMIRNSRVIVFAFNAPYFLDTTEVSKLTAYFALYSKAPAFVDTAARALFQEIPLRGASPVDVRDMGYNLFQVTRPDPDQVIELLIVRDGNVESPDIASPLELQVADNVKLRTG